MKKEQVTIFNLEDAFKALDELEIPKAERGIKANKTDLVESFKDFNRSRTDLLMEDYYDIADSADLEEAKAEREAEVAKAKLARIEKIVDLEAESEEDLLPSYVGKMIIQCPQCMTLFYKDEADIVKSETDEETVNVAEACQHCGNDAGYTLIGKVEGIQEDDLIPEENVEEIPTEEENIELEPVEEVEETPEEGKEDLDLAPVEDSEEPEEEKEEIVVEESLQLNEETQNKLTENIAEADFDKIISIIKQDLIQAFDFDIIIEDGEFYEEDGFKDIYVEWKDFNCESEEFESVVNWIETNENKYENFKLNLLDEENVDFITINVYAKKALTEAVDKDLQAKLDAHNAYIEFLQCEIEKEEKALEAAKNEFIKEAIKRRLDSLYVDLDKALPEEIKDTVAADGEAPAEEAEIEIENVDTDENAVAEVPVEITDASNPVEVEPIEVKDDETKSEKPVKESLKESIDVQKLDHEDIFDNPYTALYVARNLTYYFIDGPEDAEKLVDEWGANALEGYEQPIMGDLIRDALVAGNWHEESEEWGTDTLPVWWSDRCSSDEEAEMDNYINACKNDDDRYYLLALAISSLALNYGDEWYGFKESFAKVKKSIKESVNSKKLNEDKFKDLSGEEFDELMGFLATQKTESVEEPIDEEPEQLEEVLWSEKPNSPYIKLGFKQLDPAYIFWKEDVEAELEKIKAKNEDLSNYVDEKGKYTNWVNEILGGLMKTTDKVRSEDVDIENKTVKTSKGQTYTFAEIVEKAVNLKYFTTDAAKNKGLIKHLTFVEKLRTYTDAFARKEVKIAQKAQEVNNSEHSEDIKEWLAKEVESIVVTLKGCDDISALCAECGIEENSHPGKILTSIMNSLNRRIENFTAKYPDAETEYLDALDSSDAHALNPITNFSKWGLGGVVKFRQKLHAPGYMHPEVIEMIDEALTLTIQQAKDDGEKSNFKQSFDQCTGYKVANFNFVLMLGELFGNLSFYKNTIEESFEELEDLDEKRFAKCLGEALNRKEKTVKAIKVESCSLAPDNRLIIECKVKLLDNTTTKISYICEGFINRKNQKLIKGITEGYINKEFICNYTFENKTLITESIKHSK